MDELLSFINEGNKEAGTTNKVKKTKNKQKKSKKKLTIDSNLITSSHQSTSETTNFEETHEISNSFTNQSTDHSSLLSNTSSKMYSIHNTTDLRSSIEDLSTSNLSSSTETSKDTDDTENCPTDSAEGFSTFRDCLHSDPAVDQEVEEFRRRLESIHQVCY